MDSVMLRSFVQELVKVASYYDDFRAQNPTMDDATADKTYEKNRKLEGRLVGGVLGGSAMIMPAAYGMSRLLSKHPDAVLPAGLAAIAAGTGIGAGLGGSVSTHFAKKHIAEAQANRALQAAAPEA